jgi:hypothetical protein
LFVLGQAQGYIRGKTLGTNKVLAS